MKFRTLFRSAAFALAAILAAAPAWAQSSPNLGISHIQQNQAQKEVTANEATDALDVAITDFLAVDFTGGDVTLTNTEFRENILFRATNLGADQALTVPALKRLFVVENPDATEKVTVTRGATTVDVAPGESRLLYTDGTTDGLSSASPAGNFIGLADTPGSYSGEALKVPRVNAGETGLEFAEISGGSGGGGGEAGPWRWIETQTASASAEIEFTDLSGDNVKYLIVFEDVIPSSDGVSLRAQVSTDNGSSYLAGSNYDWVLRGHADSIGDQVSETNDSDHFRMSFQTAGFGTGTNEVGAGDLEILQHASSEFTMLKGALQQLSATPEFSAMRYEGDVKTTTAVNAIRLFMSSGNIASGSFHLFALRAENPALPVSVKTFESTDADLAVSQTIHMEVADADVTFEDDFSGCQGYALTAPSGGAVSFDVQIEGVSVGSVDFADTSNTATCTTAGGTTETWATGERLEIIAPANLHSINRVAITLPGTTPAP